MKEGCVVLLRADGIGDYRSSDDEDDKCSVHVILEKWVSDKDNIMAVKSNLDG